MIVRFVLERDLNDAVNDVREKVAGAIRSAPPTLLPPVITKIDPDADPVMSIAVSSKSMSLRTLTELADKQIVRGIQTVNGVGEVSLTGGRAREIHIVVDIEKLNSYGLSLSQVRERRSSSESAWISSGKLIRMSSDREMRNSSSVVAVSVASSAMITRSTSSASINSVTAVGLTVG